MTPSWPPAAPTALQRCRRPPAWILPAGVAIAMAAMVVGLRWAGLVGPAPGGTVLIGQPQAAPAQLRPGLLPPAFSATAFGGGTVNLEAERGRVVLLNFYASWCEECRAEVPDIERAYLEHHAAGFDVIGVDALDNGDGQGFLRGLGATYPAFRDGGPGGAAGPVARAYGIGSGLPVSVFLGRDGRVALVYPGRIDGASVDAEVRSLLAA